LAGWGLRVALADLALQANEEYNTNRPLGARNAGRRAAIGTLARVFGTQHQASLWDNRDWTAVPWYEQIAVYRTFSSRRDGDHDRESNSDDLRLLDWLGPRGEDDAISIWNPVLVCASDDGAIITNRTVDGTTARVSQAQVCVRCPSTGQQHRIGVPAQFAMPLRSGETASQRIRAAVAWTFSMNPDEYRPERES
jgi:hypothetical protein